MIGTEGAPSVAFLNETLCGNACFCQMMVLQVASWHPQMKLQTDCCGAICLRRPTAELSDRHLQLQLLHALLQEQTSLDGSSQEGASLLASAMQRPSCLHPTPSGPSDSDMPATSMNREQLLLELFRLELDCQAPQV